MNEKKPRIVITSREARDNIFKARTLMDQMNNDIAIHSQKIASEKMQNEQMQRETEKVSMQNQHEQMMQRDKLNTVNSLI